jgi:DNA-binding CsgD family transcriptional regulator
MVSVLLVLFESNPRLRQASGESLPGGAFDGDMLPIYAQYVRQSPMLKSYKRGKGSAVKVSDFITQRQFHRLGLYNEYLRPLGAEYRMAKGLPGRPGWLTTVQLDRRLRDFSERDRHVLNLLRPHLNQTYRNAVSVEAARLEVARIEEGVDALERGLILLGADGAVHWMSPLAARWLETYFGPRHGRDGPLPAPISRWIRRHTEPGSRELPTVRQPMVATRDATQLIARMVPRGGQTLILLEEQHRWIPAEPLRSLGLTRRESEVLAWVAGGKTSADIASILGTSRRAVEKHLEHIYPKLGVETRTAAAARALAHLATQRGTGRQKEVVGTIVVPRSH